MTAREHIIPIFVPHIGCPHNCVFCNQKRITGKQNPTTSQEVKNAIGDDVSSQVAFYGGSFTAIPYKMQEELLAAAQGHNIRISTRPDAIDISVLKLLKKYNVKIIELGAQSMIDSVLEISGRGHKSADVINAANLIKEEGFELILQFMTGLPGDSDEKDIETAKKIIELKPNGVRIYPTVIIKDTELYDMYMHGEYKEHTVEDAVNVCSKIVPMFRDANIPIIRLGLNPTDDLSNGDAVAGAYHPALGELVYSRILRNEIEKMLYNSNGGDITIKVPKEKLSQAIGQHKTNVEYLKDKYGLKSLNIVGYN